jgi:peptidoglycan/xylan/chitin deacetylase (PgdA/CDA1 family)
MWIEEAVTRGHEIASHSWTHRKLTALGADEKRREIFESRRRLSAELGVEVRGFRAPGFAIDRESLEMIDAAAYEYDSSLFSATGAWRRLGLPRVDARTFHPLPGRRLVELPLPGYAPLPFPFHPSYSLVLGSWYFRTGLRRFRRTGAPLVLLFHLTDFVGPLPFATLPGWRAKVYSLPRVDGQGRRVRCEDMVARVRQTYEVVDTTRMMTSLQESLGRLAPASAGGCAT